MPRKHLSQKKCSEILDKLTGKHLWRSLALGCRPAALVKNILMKKLFSLNGCRQLQTAASELDKYLTTLNIIFDSAENI